MIEYGYDLAVLTMNGFKDENEAREAVFNRIIEISENIKNSEQISDEEKFQIYRHLQDIHRICKSFEQMIEASTDGAIPKWVMSFRLARLMDILIGIGGHNGASYSSMISSENANISKINKAANKNAELIKLIEDEARSKGITLKDSDKCAQRLEPGVRARAGVEPNAEGFGYPTIRRAVRGIIRGKKGQTQA